jgi:hypothetical protein
MPGPALFLRIAPRWHPGHREADGRRRLSGIDRDWWQCGSRPERYPPRNTFRAGEWRMEARQRRFLAAADRAVVAVGSTLSGSPAQRCRRRGVRRRTVGPTLSAKGGVGAANNPRALEYGLRGRPVIASPQKAFTDREKRETIAFPLAIGE